MANLATLASVESALTSISNLLLVSPSQTVGYQPQNQVGQTFNPPPILFNYEGEQTVSLESDITDHVVENNSPIQDQWALKPIIITTHGFIGELNDITPITLPFGISPTSTLTTLSAFTPALSVTALIAYNTAVQAYEVGKNAVNSAKTSISSLGGSGESIINGTQITSEPNQNQQQTYFQQFFSYWSSRTLFTVQTPWAVFTNMAIMLVRPIQDAETNVITDFQVTFKQINYAQVTNVPGTNPSDASGRLATQVSANNAAAIGASAGVATSQTTAGLVGSFN